MAAVTKRLNRHCSNGVIEATFLRMRKNHRDFHDHPISKPNAQAKLRALRVFAK